jgi:hypothetical protein
MTTGSELESYLRALQVTGRAPAYPVSLRGRSALERDSIVPRASDHPWMARFRAPAPGGGVRFALIRPEIRLVENSAFPYGASDGAVWAGKGLTTAVSGGFELRAGPLTVVVDPVFFRAENAAFALGPVPSGVRGAPYGDPVRPGTIDLPQRFGSGTYQRFDPGQSGVRLDAFGFTIGATAANEIWGPAITSPIILGDNAAGFPRLFAGTARPVNVGIGLVHGRWFAGQLGQSDWSPIDTTGGKRLAAGMVVVLQPRGLENVELGISRFFHRFWPNDGVRASDFFIPFEGFLKQGLRNKDNPSAAGGTPDNQLVSIFARVALPKSGVEIYGEYGRDDYSWNARDLSGEPDHSSAYTLGLMRAWQGASADVLTMLRAEVTNARVTAIAGGRGEGLFYRHTALKQGHTQYGQLLGSPAVRGGSGATLAFDRWSAAGRVSVSFTRTGRADETEGGLGRGATSALTLDLLRFHGGFDLSVRLGAVFETGVTGAGDRAQLRAAVGAKVPLGFPPTS